MDIVWKLAGAALVLLTVTKALFRWKFLPLGGSEPAQLAIVLGLAFVTCEVLVSLH